jgi:transposase
MTDPVKQYQHAAELEAEAQRLRLKAVSQLYREGFSVAEIAERLSISRQAANNHVRRIREAGKEPERN